MKVTMEPTPEAGTLQINGGPVPMRVWTGATEEGARVEVFVLSVVPHRDDMEKFLRACPDYMVPSRRIMDIGDHKKERSDG